MLVLVMVCRFRVDAPEYKCLAVGMSPVKKLLMGLRGAARAGAKRRPRRRLVMAPVCARTAAVGAGMAWSAEVNRVGAQRSKQPMPKGDAATSSVILLGFHSADMERDVLPQ